jgi:hypothetical protein
VLDRRVEVHAHSYRADEILALMRVAERFGFKINVQTHVLEGFRVAKEMAEHGAGGSTFTDWWHYKLEAYDAIPHNAAIMHRQGVLTAINSDISWLQAFMIYEFPKAVKWGGVSKEDALRMLTAYPARMMHIQDRVGTLEVGKDGDVVLLNGDPFDTFVRVEKTIVDGIVYYDVQDEAGTRKEPFDPLPPLPLRPASGPGTDRPEGGVRATMRPWPPTSWTEPPSSGGRHGAPRGPDGLGGRGGHRQGRAHHRRWDLPPRSPSPTTWCASTSPESTCIRG